LFNPAVLMMFATSVPLGVIGANRLLTSDAPKFPVLEMMRYAILALPLVIVTEVLLGGHALGLMGDFIGSAPMVGARFFIALLMAGAGHALANLAIWDEPQADATPATPSVDWQSRYVEARSRLAHTTVEARRAMEREQAELDAFDRKLAEALGGEVVLDVGAAEEVADETRKVVHAA
jgi:hypothetical protein